LSLPVTNETSEVTIDALKVLFKEHGAPLVIKNDNGSPFGAYETQNFLDSFGVLQLFSPPRMPEYNGPVGNLDSNTKSRLTRNFSQTPQRSKLGQLTESRSDVVASVEAGIGSFKVSAHYAAAKNDRPGQWSCDDLEAARCEMNEFGRPFGISNSSPQEVFNNREPILENERFAFWCRYKHILREVIEKKNMGNVNELKETEKRTINREALSKTLLELEYLTIRKRRVSPPFKRLKVI